MNAFALPSIQGEAEESAPAGLAVYDIVSPVDGTGADPSPAR